MVLVNSTALALVLHMYRLNRWREDQERAGTQDPRLTVNSPSRRRRPPPPPIKVLGLTAVPSPEAFMKREQVKRQLEKQPASPEKDLYGFDVVPL